MTAGAYHESAKKSNYGPEAMRAYSACVAGNPKMKRYEQVIRKLQKLAVGEKNKLRKVKTRYAKIIEFKTQHQDLLRRCVDDVKTEISRKRSENKVLFYENKKRGQSAKGMRTQPMSQQENNKIIEVLLSQERVLTLLYDKTFPPRIATVQGKTKGGVLDTQRFMEDLAGVLIDDQRDM